MPLIKVVWYVFRAKNMHPGSPSDPSGTTAAEAKPSILDFETTWSEFQKPRQTAAKQGEAELRILDFKTTWSEFHHLPRVGPKQLCALAHLGCTREVGTS